MAVGGLARWISRVPWEQFRTGLLSESVAAPFAQAGVISRNPMRLSYEGRAGQRNTDFFNQVLDRTGVNRRFTRALPSDPSQLSPAEAERLVALNTAQRRIVQEVAERHRRNFYVANTDYTSSSFAPELQGTGLGESAIGAIDDIAMRQLLEDAYAQMGINPLRRFGYRQSIDNILGNLENSEHTVNRGLRGARRFFEEGQLKNAFASGTSAADGGVGGMSQMVDPLYLYNRALSESRFGVPRNAPALERPTYGWRSLTPELMRPGANENWSRLAPVAQQYGPVQLRFGPSVNARSTFTLQDTMNPNEFGSFYNVIPRPIVGAQPEDAALAGYRFFGDAPYVESQVWGMAPSIDELSSVGAYRSVADDVARWMERAGVRVPLEIFDFAYPG
jgi:hypothetical protein